MRSHIDTNLRPTEPSSDQSADPVDGSGQTIDFLGQKLTPEEYQSQCDNLAAYFAILRRWSQEEKDGKEEA